MIVCRAVVFSDKTDFREKLKDLKRFKICSCFAFDFLKNQMKLFFKTGIHYVFESNTFSQYFLLKIKRSRFDLKTKFSDFFFLTWRTSLFLALEP